MVDFVGWFDFRWYFSVEHNNVVIAIKFPPPHVQCSTRYMIIFFLTLSMNAKTKTLISILIPLAVLLWTWRWGIFLFDIFIYEFASFREIHSECRISLLPSVYLVCSIGERERERNEFVSFLIMMISGKTITARNNIRRLCHHRV